MKKIFLTAIALMLACGFVSAADEKKEDDKTKKTVFMNFSKGDQFNNVSGGSEQSLSEEHLTGKEKVRMKVKGSVGMYGFSKNVDWSKYNYLVFNAFLTGDAPWKGMLLIGDKDSYKKWSRNYVEVPLSLKPGENKEVHVGIEGLFSSYANRELDMKNVQCLQFYNNLPETYFGNLYLVYEEE